MNTTAAATTAGVTTATIRTWCRRNAIAAVKRSGRWFIDAASLTARIAIGHMKATRTTPARNLDLDAAIGAEAAQASYLGSAAGLHPALAYVQARNIGAFIDPTGVRIADTQWNDLADLLRSEIANLTSERRTQRAIYDYA